VLDLIPLEWVWPFHWKAENVRSLLRRNGVLIIEFKTDMDLQRIFLGLRISFLQRPDTRASMALLAIKKAAESKTSLPVIKT